MGVGGGGGHDAGRDWTVQLLQPLLHNEYAYGRVCVPLCALMCVLVCELSHTPPHLCLGRLISVAHKGGLCVPRRTQDIYLSGKHNLTLMQRDAAFLLQNLCTKGDDIEENLVDPKS